MNAYRNYFKYLAMLMIVINLFFLSACGKTANETTPVTPTYDLPLISATEIETISKVVVSLALGSYFPTGLDNSIQYNVKSYKLIYQTQYKGATVQASGIIFIPEGKTSSAWVSVQHGTILDQESAPSAFKLSGDIESIEALYMVCASSIGFITFAADYLGYGESRTIVHPYIHNEITAQTTLDMLRAAQSFLKAMNITPTKLFLTGYSEGGYATLSLQKQIEKDATEFTLTAVSAGGGPTDLLETMQIYLTGGDQRKNMSGFSSFVLYSYNKTYGWDRPLTDFFQSSYAQSLQNNAAFGTSQYQLFNRVSANALLNPTFLSDCQDTGEQTLKNALIENSLYNWEPIAPLRLYHGDSDTIVPSANSTKAYNTFIQKGATQVTLHYIAGADHTDAVSEFLTETMLWFYELSL